MRIIRFILSVTVFFGILIGANIYLARSFGYYFSAEALTFFYVASFSTTIFMMAGVMRFVNATKWWGSLIFMLAAIIMGFTLYLLLSTILIDILGLIFIIKPLYMGIAALLIAFIVSAYGIWNSYNLKINEVEIEINGLEKPIRAAHLTDTHLGHFRGASNLKKIVKAINLQQVDVVFFTGDLLDSKIQLKPESMAPLADLEAPVFFVEGNHDLYTGVRAIKRYLDKLGVHVLENEMYEWQGIQIIGLNHMLADSATFNVHVDDQRTTIKSVLEGLDTQLDNTKPTVLLHHSPDGIQYANEAGVDLYLAGHTHAGQLWPITHIAKAMFAYNRGMHQFKETLIYVSQGTGTFGPPMRVGTYSELAILNLTPLVP